LTATLTNDFFYNHAMSRRSSRLEEKKRATGVDPYDAIIQQLGLQETLDGEPVEYESDSVNSDEEIDRRPRKRSKRVESYGSQGAKDKAVSPIQRVRGRRGILQKVQEMPLDILFEVSPLTLHDLLC
jgi:hypothetical protein